MRALINGFVAFLAAVAALGIVYPWSTYYENFEFAWWTTLSAYLLVAGVLGIAAGVSSQFLAGLSRFPPAIRGLGCGLVIFAVSVLLAFAFGPMGMTVPGTRLRGIFFAEWRFISFLVYVGAPVAIIAALFCGWRFGRSVRP